MYIPKSLVFLSALLALPGSLAHDRLGLRGRKPAALQARKEAEAELLARRELDIGLDRRWANDTGSSRRYYNNQTKPYFVESLPDVNYDLGEMYSGLIPIDWSNASRALFFVWQPTIGAQVDEVTIWLNGGPGCSSLEGFFQETGRFVWQPGTYLPLENQYSWVNLTNMLWVEYPVGVGFSIGDVTADNEVDISQDFIKWFKNFQELFGISNYKIYVTGESYAGRYVPYVSDAMIEANDTKHYDLKGALIYDPCIGEFDTQQEEIPVYPFLQANQAIFNLNDTYMEYLAQVHQDCGYADFLDKYLTFPPPGNQPPLFFNYSDPANATCDVFDDIYNAAITVNPCFDAYDIATVCPILWDVLGFPGSIFYSPPGADIYFNRSDVKKAIHAPDDINWAECSNDPVFSGGLAGPQSEGDISPDPIQNVLPKVIEHTNRVLIGNGDYDMIIITNGTLLAIQNMTWNGQLGFQNAPNESIVIDLPELQYLDAFEANYGTGLGAQGVMGIQHYERGLMWAEAFQSGHMQPQYQARSSYRHLQWLLGHVDAI